MNVYFPQYSRLETDPPNQTKVSIHFFEEKILWEIPFANISQTYELRGTIQSNVYGDEMLKMKVIQKQNES